MGRQRDSWCLFLALSVSLLLPFLSLALFSLTLHNYVWFVFRYNIIQYLNCASAARTGSTIDGRDDVGVGYWGVVVVTLMVRWVRAPITEEESAEKPISARSDIRFCYSQRGKWKQTADRNKLQVQDCRAVDHLISRLPRYAIMLWTLNSSSPSISCLIIPAVCQAGLQVPYKPLQAI